MDVDKLADGQRAAVAVTYCQGVFPPDHPRRRELTALFMQFLADKASAAGGTLFRLDGPCGFVAFQGDVVQAIELADAALLQFPCLLHSKGLVPFDVAVCVHTGYLRLDPVGDLHIDCEGWLQREGPRLVEAGCLVLTQQAYGWLDDPRHRNRFCDPVRYTPRQGLAIDVYRDEVASRSVLYSIAHAHHEEHRALSSLAERFGRSLEQVTALLKLAQLRGIVSMRVEVVVPVVEDLQRRLAAAFPHLKHVGVVECRSQEMRVAAATLAVAFARRLGIDRSATIAVSCGQTILAVSEQLMSAGLRTSRARILPLVITMSPDVLADSPIGVVWSFVRALPHSSGFGAQYPGTERDLLRSAERKAMFLDECRPILEEAGAAQFMFTGIGAIPSGGTSHSFSKYIQDLGLTDCLLNKLNAVGETCYQPFTVDGERVIDSPELEQFRNNLIYVDLPRLQHQVRKDASTIMGVAVGPDKHESVLGALRTKAFNVLFTDVETARFVLDNA